MRGYVLPIVLALLLAAPMLWRMEGEVEVAPATAARVVFKEIQPEGALAARSAAPVQVESDQVVPLLPAADRDLGGDPQEPLVRPASLQPGD